ncbi:MAG: hypothetical protein A2W17_09245 [Planctomycetes bacterium RBG_16_41_13]|nr:MAG: hypothetical protein A2W17_09245 [Planctomycetes bacterium RBG_16_41_13]
MKSKISKDNKINKRLEEIKSLIKGDPTLIIIIRIIRIIRGHFPYFLFDLVDKYGKCPHILRFLTPVKNISVHLRVFAVSKFLILIEWKTCGGIHRIDLLRKKKRK